MRILVVVDFSFYLPECLNCIVYIVKRMRCCRDKSEHDNISWYDRVDYHGAENIVILSQIVDQLCYHFKRAFKEYRSNR